MALASIGVTGADSAAFGVDSSMMADVLRADVSTTFTITFSPGRPGGHSAVLEIGGTAPGFSLTMNGTGLATFESWAASQGLSLDPAASGGVNLLRFGFGTPPEHPHRSLAYSGPAAGGGALTATGMPVILPVESPGGTPDLRAVFVRRKDHLLIGLTYTVQFSVDLAQWQSSADQPFVLADDGTHEVVSVPFPVLSGGVKPRFFRIDLSVSP